MDLFNLVAKLTLDASEYESGIKAAQKEASDSGVDVIGNAVLDTTDYSAGISDAERLQSGFDGDVDAEASLDTDDYTQGLTDAETKTDTFSTNASAAFEKIKTALIGAGIVAAVKGIANSIGEAVQQAAQYADTVDKGSRALSMSAEAYQVWQHALKQSGADIGDVSRGWMNLTDAMTGGASDEVASALESLAIDPSQFQTTEKLFDSVISSLAEISSGAERDMLVTALFGRNGKQLNALLDSGADGIDALKKEAYELGLVMSGENIDAGVAYGDAVANMNAAVDALKANIVSGLFPVLTDAARMITQIVAFFNGSATSGEKGIDEWFSDIDDSMKSAFAGVAKDEATTNSLIQTLKDMSTESGTASTNLDVWRGVAEKLIEVCPSLANQIDLVNGKFNEQNGTLEDNAKAWFDSARAQAVSTALSSKQAALAEQATKVVEKQIDKEVKAAEAEGALAQARTQLSDILTKHANWSTYSAEDVAGMDASQIYDILNGIYAEGLDRKGETNEAFEAARSAISLAAEVAGMDDEIAAMETELAAATEEYGRYEQAANDYLKTIQEGLNAIPERVTVSIDINDPSNIYGFSDYEPHAKGLNYVPYDGYRAILHRGEMVLNADSARSARNGGDSSMGLPDAVAKAVSDAMRGLTVNMDGQTVGGVVTMPVSENMSAQARRWRYM